MLNFNASTTPAGLASLSRKIVNMDIHEQKLRLRKAQYDCEQRILLHENTTAAENATAQGCSMVWDNILCWDAAPPGTVQHQSCPDYINQFDTHEFATKYCTPNGTWYRHYTSNNQWTNYSACFISQNLHIEVDIGERLKLIQTIGYGVSLCSLLVAVLLMCCSRLKSKSNTLHINLFLAFIFRASFSFLRNLLFVQGLGLEKDVERKGDGTVSFRHDGTHWECRLLHTLFMYTICASQMWIFVEGLYLHMLIYRTLSTERNGVRPYVVLGWVLPVVIVVPWIFVKALVDNTLCWNITANPLYMWIIHGPMLATVLLNFLFFLNISRVLCSRVRSSQRHMGRSKYRHLAKFILVLIPLFGLFYIVLAVAFPLGYASRFNITQMYVEQTYNSFQGFLLALLFCFLNEEVHSEMRRLWWTRLTRRRDSVATRSYVLSSYKKNSSHNRTSLNVGQPLQNTSRLVRTDSTDAKQESWFTRLKNSVLRLLGRDSAKVSHAVRSAALPMDASEFSHAERANFASDEMDLDTKFRNTNYICSDS